MAGFIFLDTMQYNVLVIGGGGREHVIAWKLSQSPHVSIVYRKVNFNGNIVYNNILS